MRLSLPRNIRWPGGLSSRLLLLTAAFVLIAEIMILVPSLAAFQERWLLDRVRQAEIASGVVEAAPDQLVPDRLARQLLKGAGVSTVAVQIGGVRRLVLPGPRLETVPDYVDLRSARGVPWLFDPWRTLFGSSDRMIRVTARPQFRSGDFIEIVVPAQPLKAELGAHMLRVLGLSILISALAGGLVYGALSAFIVQPMIRLTESIERFRSDPEDPGAAPEISGRRDEIGRIEEELGRMQDEVRGALKSRARLAALGEAVAKINHDLRNMLTSAQMASERLAVSGDPAVAKALPRLERALDRAMELAQNVLNYGKSEEPAPVVGSVPVALAVQSAAEDAGLSQGGVSLDLDAEEGMTVEADPDQLARILVNLMRNARQAVEALPARGGVGRVTVSVRQDAVASVIRVADDGPGIPGKTLERLFQPFAGSARPGGAGLGLAISRELAKAHGGDLVLVETGSMGTVFEVRLPRASVAAMPAPLQEGVYGTA